MSATSMLSTTIKKSIVKQEVEFVKKQRKFEQPTTSKKCYFCGGIYDPSHKCPARGKSCSKCGNTNNFACVCRRKPIDTIDLTEIHGNKEHEVYLNILFIGSVAEKVSQPTAAIKLSNSAWESRFKIDRGAEANVIPKSIYDRLKPRPQLNKTSQILVAYGGTNPHSNCWSLFLELETECK